jgi:hypothetical protein
MSIVHIPDSPATSLDNMSTALVDHQCQVRGDTLGVLQELVTKKSARICCYPRITESGLEAVIIGDSTELNDLNLNETARCFALTANQNIHLRSVSFDSGIACSSIRNELINLAIECRDVVDIRQDRDRIRITTQNSPELLSEAIAERVSQNEIPVTAQKISELSDMPLRQLEAEAKRSFHCQPLKYGFSEPLVQLPSHVLAELMVRNAISSTVEEDSEQVASAIREAITRHLPDARYWTEHKAGFTSVQIQGDESLLKSVGLYEALQELRATLPLDIPLLFTIAPILIDRGDINRTAHQEAPLKTAHRFSQNDPVPAIMTDKFFNLFGTQYPWRLAHHESNDSVIAHIGCVEPEKLREIDQVLQQISGQSNVTIIRRSFDADTLNTVCEHPGRDSMSRPEFMQAIASLRQRIEGSRSESAWAKVEAVGNMAVVKPICALAAESLPGLRELSKYLPIPIVLLSPEHPQRIESAAQLRSLLKMMLPERARIETIESEGNSLSAFIQVTDGDYVKMQRRCQNLVESMEDSSLSITVKAYDPRLYDALRNISPRTGKKMLSVMDDAGRISMDTWLDERDRARSPSRHTSLYSMSPSFLEGLLATHKDRRYLKLLTVDPKGTKLKEDGLSIEELPDGSMNLWVHLVNSSVLIPPFSSERMRAYRFGASQYHPYAGVAPLLAQSKRFSLVEGLTMPVVSVCYHLSRPHGHWQQCESPHVELSLVRSHAAIQYDRSQSLGHLTETGRFAPELKLAASAAIALTLDPNVGLVHSLTQMIQSEFPRYLLRRANMDISKTLANTGYAAVYQHDHKPSFEMVSQFVSHLNSTSIRELMRRPLAEIYENDEHLRILIMKVYAYNRRHGIESSVNMGEFGLPALTRGPNFSLGIDHSMRFSGSARRAEALVNMHQLSAAFGCHEALSHSEISAIFESLSEARRRVPSLKREMELMYALDQVADAMKQSSHFSAQIEKIVQRSEGTRLLIRARIGAEEHQGYVILKQNLASSSQDYSVGQTLNVRPLYYDLVAQRFCFEIEYGSRSENLPPS